MKSLLIAIIFLVMVKGPAFGHLWYDTDCCGGNDCEAVHIRTDNRGDYAILKNGAKWYIINPRSVRPSKDDDYHICIHQNQVRCLYIPTGT